MNKALLEKENARLRVWVSDLLSGMYVNCVYCGHRYGPAKDTPVAMADVLKAHIEVCPEHPLSIIRLHFSRLKSEIRRLKEESKLLRFLNQTSARSVARAEKKKVSRPRRARRGAIHRVQEK